MPRVGLSGEETMHWLGSHDPEMKIKAGGIYDKPSGSWCYQLILVLSHPLLCWDTGAQQKGRFADKSRLSYFQQSPARGK